MNSVAWFSLIPKACHCTAKKKSLMGLKLFILKKTVLPFVTLVSPKCLTNGFGADSRDRKSVV